MTRFIPTFGGTDRDVATAVNQALMGKLNSVGAVTLDAGATTTDVKNAFASKSSVILFAAQTANAAAIALPYVKPSDVTEGDGFTITHANDANADKTFGYVILG